MDQPPQLQRQWQWLRHHQALQPCDHIWHSAACLSAYFKQELWWVQIYFNVNDVQIVIWLSGLWPQSLDGELCPLVEASQTFFRRYTIVMNIGKLAWYVSNTIEVDVNTMSNGQCQNTVYSASDISSNMLCASRTGKDSCQGDSGGPLVTREGSFYSVIGRNLLFNWGSLTKHSIYRCCLMGLRMCPG